MSRVAGRGVELAHVEGESGGSSWLRAWLVVGLAAWAAVGVVLVQRANVQGLIEDITFSPYHLVGYAALLVLAIYVAWAFLPALRRGTWRSAFPPMYGGLGLAVALLLTWVILDAMWQGTLGVNPGIEGGIAPPRLLIPVALALIAAGPLRVAIAERERSGLAPGEMRTRWAGVAAAGIVGATITLVAFNPVRDPLQDWTLNPGVDATEIWVMRSDGASQTRLLAAKGDGVDYSLPAWSPDGERIAYTAWTNDGGARQNIQNDQQTAGIWTMAADGSDRRLVVDGAPDHAWIPSWSPDGQWIAYTVSPQGQQAAAPEPQANQAPGQVGPPTSTAGASIWIANPSTGVKRRLSPETMDAVGPTWSPDGTRIAFIAAAGGGSSDIHVANVDNPPSTLTDDHVLAGDPANDWGPAWSSDGTKIAFTSDRSGNDDIWVVSADGGAPTQLTDDRAGDWVPVWAPDDTAIAFTSDRSGDPDVWLMSSDGSEPLNLTNHPQHYDGQWSVAWSPDGNTMAYATGSFQDASSSGWVREDFAAAQSIIFGLGLAIVALLIVALGAPLGSFAVALTIVVAMSAAATDQWRFLPAALVAGLITDGVVRSVRLRHRPRVAAALLPTLANLAIGLTIGAGGSLAWSITLLLGVSLMSGVFGWALAEVAGRLLPRPVVPITAPAEASAG